MTAEQSAELRARMEALTAILATLEELRADYADEAVEWVIEQLNQ